MGSTTAVKLKLHRRNVELDGERFTVLALRPMTTERFATTKYQDTWHILCNPEGADLLGRLAWAMAFQSRKHTVMLVDLPQIAKDPFDAAPTAPIIVVNSELDAPTPAAIASLRAQIPLAEPSEGSVRLMTAGFDRALVDPDRFWAQERDDDPALKAHQHARWIEQVSGVVVLAAPPPVLRQWAVRVAELAARGPLDPEWTPAREHKWTGEVQVLARTLA
jgi:hypothetical protein